MARIELHAGDWGRGSGTYGSILSVFSFPTPGSFQQETVMGNQLASIEIASEESVKRIGGAAGWGAIGALALGPVGLLAGMLLGGRGKDVTLIATFKDGRKLLATTDSKTFVKLQALVF